LSLFRSMLSVVVAVAIAFAPMATAWAGGAKVMGTAMPHMAHHAGEDEGSAAVAPMEDCALMLKGAANAVNCPCCDKDNACTPQFCMAKCFQLLGMAMQSGPVAALVLARLRPTVPARPPDWSAQPQPPPPRT